MSQATPQRAVLEGVISPAACRELIFIARSLEVVGYRDFVCSATIFEVAAAAPALLAPLVAAREAVHAAVEEALGLPMGLLVEFTGLISWRPGSSIGWHHDANRPYLQQRAYSAVCYLNSGGGIDFEGGSFLFADHVGNGSGGAATPTAVTAAPGRVVAYSAQDVHSVQPVAAGERFTLTLWFTTDPSHCEDAKLLAQLAHAGSPRQPLPATMWLLPDGTDLRLCRLAMAGLGLVMDGRMLASAAEAEELMAAAAEAEAGSAAAGSAAAGSAAGGEDGAEKAPLRLQLAVQPAAWQAWLDCERDGQPAPPASEAGEGAVRAAAAPGSPGSAVRAAPTSAEADGQPAAAEAVLMPGVTFASVQQAVLALQHWLWQRGGGAGTRERVCCRHLCSGDCSSGSASCSWLRSCRLRPGSDCGSQGSSSLAGFPLQEALQKALAASGDYLQRQHSAVDALLPQWREMGAVFWEAA